MSEQKAPGEKKSGKKKTPLQKRAEAAQARAEMSQEQIDEAIRANGGFPKTQAEEPPKIGRPTRITEIDLERVEMYAAGGLTKAEIADAIGIALSTLMTYQKDYPEFLEAIAKGRRRDIEEIENALHKAAKGYTVMEDKIFYDSQVGRVVVQPTVKRVNPDTKAAIAILRKAETGSWKDKQDVNHSGTINQVVKYHKPEREKDD